MKRGMRMRLQPFHHCQVLIVLRRERNAEPSHGDFLRKAPQIKKSMERKLADLTNDILSFLPFPKSCFIASSSFQRFAFSVGKYRAAAGGLPFSETLCGLSLQIPGKN
jgi:hypothetical protein